MITVVFHLTDWEQFPGMDNPRSQMYVWLLNAKGLGADKLVMIDKTKMSIGNYYKHEDAEVLFEKFDRVEDFLDTLPDETEKVILEVPRGESTCQEVKTLGPPSEDVVYVVGPDDGSVNLFNLDGKYKNLSWVYINIPRPQVALYSHLAAMLALYSRFSESG